ncbi:hypothetical protein [Bacillus weihaiensis]|uniref:VOC domain-containing protein n=1 Tax=Bacillus weihaiensis TaxID=1547283 RepID=A0A1L3MLS5_9BACI|nr:hypothetical protein [Bacillus weihaiensis]APH03291.1 hypothetical protein A9C19_00160 [Bacillus weihaiensis]
MDKTPFLFHYHFWTPYLEETEEFYRQQGFEVTQRIGKLDGTFQSFNPPLTWDDFRHQNILFRIIECQKGKVNVTLGYGKKVVFDHLGFYVSEDEKVGICQRAEMFKWKVESNDRRTFISTPYQFRIELQTHEDAIYDMESDFHLLRVGLSSNKEDMITKLKELLGVDALPIDMTVKEKMRLESVEFCGTSLGKTDPNGLFLK